MDTILRKPTQPVILALLSLVALVGMALVAYATAHGPGVGGDATIYLTSAQNLLAGNGLGWVEADGSFRVLPYSPPFYPLVLSAVGLVARDMVAGARWLNVLLFGATVLLIGWQFYRAAGRAWLAVVLAGLLATSPVLIGVQVWAMAESLTIFLGFAGLALLLNFLNSPRRSTLLASAGLVGLAFLTRYIAAAFVGTALLALLIYGLRKDENGNRKLALLDWIAYGVVAVLPMLVWLVIDFSLTGTIGSRSAQPVSAYAGRFLAIGPALQEIYLFWLVPESVAGRLPGVVKVLAWLVPLAALALLAAWTAARLRQVGLEGPDSPTRLTVRPAARLAGVYALFTGVYLLVLAVVQVFTYPPVTLASRMLAPVHLAVLALLLALLHLALTAWSAGREPSAAAAGSAASPAWAPALVYLLGLALLGSYALRGFLIARTDHQVGIGYTAPAWQESTTIAVLKDIPPSVPIISNETTAVMFLTGRPAYPLQEIYQDEPLETFTAYGQGNDPAQRLFRETDAALVLFTETLHEDFAMYGDRAEERIEALHYGLFPFYVGEDGMIYFWGRPKFMPTYDCL